jgi:peptide subunit release factor RF-3
MQFIWISLTGAQLFEVCRMRELPTFTFCNKMDRPAMSPFDIIDEIEKVCAVHVRYTQMRRHALMVHAGVWHGMRASQLADRRR